MADAIIDLATPRREGKMIAYPVKGSVAIQKGVMAVLGSDGYLTDTITDPSGNIVFAGVTVEAVASQASDGGAKCRVHKSGIFEFAMSGAAITDVEKKAYISDNQTVKTTANGAVQVGVIVAQENANKVFVDIARR